jgi:uncharacterized protein YjbJ (UPF0337 family)
MNQDRVNGAIDEVVGSAKQQFGKLTGNRGTQIEGAVQNLKGKTENAWGKTKDAVNDAQSSPSPSDEEAAGRRDQV